MVIFSKEFFHFLVILPIAKISKIWYTVFCQKTPYGGNIIWKTNEIYRISEF